MDSQTIYEYTPNYRQRIGFFATWGLMLTNIVKSRELIFQLFKRDFLSAYKKSFVGLAWIFISPLVGIISWVVLNYAGVLKPGDVGIPFTAFVLLSSSLWGLFMGFYSSSAGTLSAGAGFIMQVKYPHEALLVKQIAQHLANFVITFAVNIVVLLLFGIMPSWTIILFPILILPLFFLAAGMGLFMSVISVVATDITSIFNILLGLVFYVTPIVYTTQSIQSNALKWVIELNPLTYLVGGIRDLIIYGHMEYVDRFVIAAIFSFVFFMLSWRLFFVSEDKVVEKMI